MSREEETRYHPKFDAGAAKRDHIQKRSLDGAILGAKIGAGLGAATMVGAGAIGAGVASSSWLGTGLLVGSNVAGGWSIGGAAAAGATGMVVASAGGAAIGGLVSAVKGWMHGDEAVEEAHETFLSRISKRHRDMAKIQAVEAKGRAMTRAQGAARGFSDEQPLHDVYDDALASAPQTPKAGWMKRNLGFEI